MGKLGNTLAMLKLLETGRKYSIKELSKKIEVSPRMIKEYKVELEKAGIYIDTIYGVYGGYVYNKKNNYEVSFSINDVKILERIIDKLPDKEKQDLEYLLEKIKTIVIYSEHQSVKENPEETRMKLNYLSRAIKNNSEISIIYNGKNKLLIPHNISYYKDFIYVTGFSKSDDDLRTYNLSEINLK